MSTSDRPAVVANAGEDAPSRRLIARPRPAATDPPPQRLTDIRARRQELQQHLRTSRAVHRLARAHFEVAACDMLLPTDDALTSLPDSRGGQCPPSPDLMRDFGSMLAPTSLHTLADLLHHLERYEADLSEEMAELTDSLVLLLQADPSSCLPPPRSAQ